ncbi:unnamed protein product [Urochloa humidicola]
MPSRTRAPGGAEEARWGARLLPLTLLAGSGRQDDTRRGGRGGGSRREYLQPLCSLSFSLSRPAEGGSRAVSRREARFCWRRCVGASRSIWLAPAHLVISVTGRGVEEEEEMRGQLIPPRRGTSSAPSPVQLLRSLPDTAPLLPPGGRRRRRRCAASTPNFFSLAAGGGGGDARRRARTSSLRAADGGRREDARRRLVEHTEEEEMRPGEACREREAVASICAGDRDLARGRRSSRGGTPPTAASAWVKSGGSDAGEDKRRPAGEQRATLRRRSSSASISRRRRALDLGRAAAAAAASDGWARRAVRGPRVHMAFTAPPLQPPGIPSGRVFSRARYSTKSCTPRDMHAPVALPRGIHIPVRTT